MPQAEVMAGFELLALGITPYQPPLIPTPYNDHWRGPHLPNPKTIQSFHLQTVLYTGTDVLFWGGIFCVKAV
ncbi:hypothetical protein DC3_39120 [Deinococcus cellulosilyticus NBRC 106333 = KACC 11606]|uniref:Uncharacterized protein n=1 Tax=Deinococcus cellulosilyticus (strain DSM 18568 / NBRC 106333 / KACC 11606 / 5516J-15) TaxID=1223518 RepID=A0A511N720_DEIC1|nr:hypothetical protein DC3_39120 [Deinococcus cellulosilyticus NBRC 106333 = KACC 11606]